MESAIAVGISDYKASRPPGTLVTYALGSCVGVVLYDPVTSIGGLSHIMLPSSSLCTEGSIDDRMKYADTAIPDLVAELERIGARRASLKAKIVGGANMFRASGTFQTDTIGDRNIEAARSELTRLGIPVVAEDVGDSYGRTVYFLLEEGKVKVRSLGRAISEIGQDW
ncbi:MAG: chemotaxis protein CheD [Clostridiales bacterium]|nr:chemotaxis protein CheD [Clostridiales bacterium]